MTMDDARQQTRQTDRQGTLEGKRRHRTTKQRVISRVKTIVNLSRDANTYVMYDTPGIPP